MTLLTGLRRLLDVELTPVLGARFQPTGFPDIGPAEYERPVRDDGQLTWKPALLVESPQSMANRLEAQGWDESTTQPVPTLSGLPYVRVMASDDGRYLTSSRTEAHRLASAFVKNSGLDGRSMKEVIRERLDLRDDTPLSHKDLAAAVMAMDPLCLVHGVFFAEDKKVWPGQPKLARAVTGFVEAIDVKPVVSGGVKRDHVRHGITEGEGGSREGYGSIPFHRTEYVAGEIMASFSIDLGQLRSYGLGEAATALLDAIARWEIRSLLDAGLRLRTACDLMPLAEPAERDGTPLPPAEELHEEIRRLVGECSDLLGDGAPIEVSWPHVEKQSR